MDDVYGSHQTFNFKIIERAFTPSSSPQHHINFNFFFEFKLSQWVLNQFSTALQVMGQINYPSIIHRSACITVQQYLFYEKTRQVCYQETCETIERSVLSYLPLSDHMCQMLIELACEEAWQGVRAKTICGYKVVNLVFQIQVEDRHVFDPFQEIDESCMVSAAVSSVHESLKKYDIDSENTKSCCCICLEDFSGEDCEALPCSHVFHGDCIKKWLTTSHFCPLCRLEMPTA